MVANNYFVANDYDLAFNLQNLFHEYVTLYTKLHYPENQYDVSNKERRELTYKLQESTHAMALIVTKMKRFKSGTETLNKANHQTVDAAKQNYRLSYIQ